MKKILVALSVILFLTPFVLATGPTPTYTGYAGGYAVGAPQGMGTAIPGQGQLAVQYPTFNPRINILAPAAASNTAYGTISVSTFTASTPLLPGTSTVYLNNYTDIITPRNFVFVATGTFNTTTSYIRASALIKGTDMFGQAQTETVNFSTGNVPGYLGVGVCGWSTTSSITVSYSSCTLVAATSAIVTDIGSGNALAIEAKLDSTTEQLKVLENNAIATTGTYNTTYNTYTPASAPNGTQNYMLLVIPKMR